METVLLSRLATLSHPQRMGVFRLLMRRCPDEVPAGEIAAALGLKASTASVYLSALLQAGLISQRRAGTRLLYAVDLDAMRTVVADLFMDCCRGRADVCPPQMAGLLASLPPAQTAAHNVLFVCTGNSARSLIAETLLRDMGSGRFAAFSAGTHARPRPNPFAVQLLRAKGHDVRALRPKTIREFQREGAVKLDYVFTICDAAANEDCPMWPHQPLSGHWGVPDPAKATGTQAQIQRVFEQTYATLRETIAAFIALPLNSLDRAIQQHRIDDIGTHQRNRITLQ